jgi:hypothetical protein
LGNAILMAGVTGKPVGLPLVADAYERLLQELTAKYGGRKKLETREGVVGDMSSSFSKP